MKEFMKRPELVLVLGAIPAIAALNTVQGALMMGIGTLIVLVLSTLILAAVRNKIKGACFLIAYLFVVSTLTVLVQMLAQAFVTGAYGKVGDYWLLVIVNCLVLNCAALSGSQIQYKKAVLGSLFMGIGFVVLTFVIGLIRELFGTGSIAGIAVPGLSTVNVPMLATVPGGFFVLGVAAAVLIAIKGRKEEADA